MNLSLGIHHSKGLNAVTSKSVGEILLPFNHDEVAYPQQIMYVKTFLQAKNKVLSCLSVLLPFNHDEVAYPQQIMYVKTFLQAKNKVLSWLSVLLPFNHDEVAYPQQIIPLAYRQSSCRKRKGKHPVARRKSQAILPLIGSQSYKGLTPCRRINLIGSPVQRKMAQNLVVSPNALVVMSCLSTEIQPKAALSSTFRFHKQKLVPCYSFESKTNPEGYSVLDKSAVSKKLTAKPGALKAMKQETPWDNFIRFGRPNGTSI
ncbi:hypothetical protein RRG08_050332 [Elysia crispata]|uniref:Uncharacterized protein n=1 Tax=Elysia crispata TaxID=231223 RepID=A0AAE1DPC2_9GAST|nr:hypothetical protein RRG08_050332 [Elysia crispata]